MNQVHMMNQLTLAPKLDPFFILQKRQLCTWDLHPYQIGESEK